MKIAIALRGGVSKVQNSYPFMITGNQDAYIDVATCARSFKRNILDPNRQHQIDLYLHSWNVDLRKTLRNEYCPDFDLFEDNEKFQELLHQLSESSYENAQKAGFIPAAGQNLSNIPGISQALALQRVYQLIKSHENSENPYDAIFFYRPDLILVKQIYFSDYSLLGITCNNFMDRMGDFHFFVPRNYANDFSNVVNSISEGNFEQVHHWIKRYVENNMHISYFQDGIEAGIHQEVLRKIRTSQISKRMAHNYGLSDHDWNQFST